MNHAHGYDLNLATREAYLHSHYSTSGDEESGVEYRMATTFVKNLHILGHAGTDPVLVHLQSPGGDWGHGMAMYDAIVVAPFKITMLAYGEISSMSSIIFQAPHRRVMMANAEFMIHRGYLTLDGVSSTVVANAVWNKKMDHKMLQIYAARAINGEYFKRRKMNQNQVFAFIDKKINKLGDWNLDAAEAVHFGFADAVVNNSDEFIAIRS